MKRTLNNLLDGKIAPVGDSSLYESLIDSDWDRCWSADKLVSEALEFARLSRISAYGTAQDKAEAARIVGFFPNAEEVSISLLSYGQRGIDADAA